MPQSPTLSPASIRFWDARHNRAVRNVATVRDQALVDFGISSAEWFVLDVAHAARKGGISVGEVASIIDVQTTYIALILRRLQTKKLVRTELSKQDRRIHLVYLTDAGVKKLRDSEAALTKAFAIWTKRIGEDMTGYMKAVDILAETPEE